MSSLSGQLGPLSGRTLLSMLEASQASGTLAVYREELVSFILLRRGKSQSHTDLSGAELGPFFDIDLSGASFDFWPHAESFSLPTLPLYTGGAQHRGFWALPTLFETPLYSTAEADLRALTLRLEEERFSGALTVGNSSMQGLLLFTGGQLCGALYCETGNETRARGGMLALRALLHLGQPAEMRRYTLPYLIVISLLGLLLNLRQSHEAEPDTFSGLELTPGAVRYYRAGKPYLQLAETHPSGADQSTSGFFSVCARPPNLKLPTEPSDWEQRRYGLTLRGRDALNPMTELAMRFRGEFGYTGQRTLELFRQDPSLEVAAGDLDLEPGELKTTVERLEADGFIRRHP